MTKLQTEYLKSSKTFCGLVLLLASISACSTYPSKFKCGDARGLGCTMMRDVDKQIDSGEIEEVYKKPKKCRGNKCSNTDKSEATLELKKLDKAKRHKAEEGEILEDDQNLYF